MNPKTIGSLFIIATFVVGIIVFAPAAFADKSVTITTGSGMPNPACVSTQDCFTPNPVNVAPGETVTWTNTDSAPNTVTSGKPDNSTGSVFDSGLLKPGNTFSHTFTAADVGTINYFSEIHPWITGQVIVAASGEIGTPSAPTAAINVTAGISTATPEFGPVASLVLVIAIVSVIAVTAKTRGFLKL
jgi:predicted secreted protein with PEFG-CTERM motif